ATGSTSSFENCRGAPGRRARPECGMLQGVLHIHSTYSDGEFKLAELREIYLASGCRFACVTDHADAFASDPGRLDDYRRECDARSDDRFRFIAGLEYTCD